MLVKRPLRIAILSGNHVCHNPRAFKEANALATAGYEVVWLGAWYNEDKAERDRRLIANVPWTFQPVTDWTRGAKSGPARFWQRGRRRVAIEAYKRLNIEVASQLGYCVPELLCTARETPADLYIAHSEPALWVAQRLLEDGRRVGVDMEDWFSEDLLPASRQGRPIAMLKKREKTLLAKGVHRTCPSHAMSERLAKVYECPPPTVIYNAFPWSDRATIDGLTKDRVDRSTLSAHWFSQTIGLGRGLEDLFSALPMLNQPLEIHLRGEIGTEATRWVEEAIPSGWRNRLFIHPLVHNDELLSRIAEHDIGLALEPKEPPNRNFTIANKILQYLLGGLAVVASDTAGHEEVAEQAAGAVTIYESGNPESLALVLNRVIESNELIRRSKQLAVQVAEQTFCWERVKGALTDSVERALE